MFKIFQLKLNRLNRQKNGRTPIGFLFEQTKMLS